MMRRARRGGASLQCEAKAGRGVSLRIEAAVDAGGSVVGVIRQSAAAHFSADVMTRF